MKHLIPLAVACLSLTAAAFAQTIAPVPSFLTFQGRLAKPDGTPVPDTNAQTLTFSLYDAATGGNLLWTQTSANVAVHNGAFAVKLDFSTGFQGGKSFNGTFANPLITPYLQTQVGTNAPLTPRQPFASTAYSFLAGTVPDGSLTASKFASGVLGSNGNAGGDLTGAYPNPSLATLFTSLGKVSGGLLTATGGGGAAAIDQQQTQAGNSVTIASGGGTAWQSFTPAVSGNLTAVSLYVGSANFSSQTVTLNLYPGEGTGGIAAYSNSVTIAPTLSFQSFPLSPVVPLQAGQRYTIALTGSNFLWSGSLGNPYANGDAFAPSVVPADFDFAFKTTTQPTPGLAALAPLAINGGGNTALFAQSNTGSQQSAAIAGVNNGAAGIGVSATANGDGDGVTATANGGGSGVTATANGDGAGVLALAAGAGNGVYATANGSGDGMNSNANGSGNGVSATAYGNGNGLSAAAYGSGDGMTGVANGNGNGVTGVANGSGYAGYFSGKAYISGNVGIGVAAPAFPLTFPSGGGEKIALSGNVTGPNFGISILGGILAVHTPGYYYPIAFGYGNAGGIAETMVIGNGEVVVYGPVYANSYAQNSDARYKTHVSTLDNALDNVLNLRGVTYDWDRANWKEKNFPEGKQIGFIAQELEKVLPELVSTDAKGYKSVMYSNMAPVLVEAVKTLNAKVDAQKSVIDELKKQVEELKAANAAIKKQNVTLAELAAKIERLEKANRP